MPETTCRLVQQEAGELLCHISAPPVTWPIVACWRPDAYLGKVERDLIRTVRELFSAM